MKIALVTGSNRGLGFETCKQLGQKGYHVLLCSRNQEQGHEALLKIQKDPQIKVTHLLLDVSQDASVKKAAQFVLQNFGRLDVLVNNAGIFIDCEDAQVEDASALEVPVDTIQQTLETNLFGAYRMIQAFAPLLIETAKKPDGQSRIVNVSSGMGQLSEMNGGYPAYRVSKTGLNTWTRIFSEELKDHGVLVNSICPGWVKTDMGGDSAELTPEEGADTIVWAATLPQDGPTGGFFRERKRIDW